MKDIFQTEIKYLKGVGPKRAEILQAECNITTLDDLINYFPYRYIDRSKIVPVNEINSDLAYIQIKGFITKGETIGTGAKKGILLFCKMKAVKLS